ncbi:urocanate hydratase [Erysipelotrichaceae bacterium OttesenSCG-928-M19]|nr:urocanate hydratase [Erysipelotrichaceae bacterium OttesenSCG-928-M19]
MSIDNETIKNGMEIKIDYVPTKTPEFTQGIRRAPMRELTLSESDIELALMNALRYIPEEYHDELAPEFLDELMNHGRIYGYRFRPEGNISPKPIDEYKGATIEGKACQVMIDNNLSFEIALYPYELVTYGESGQVFQNWMQYVLVKKYLEVMTNEQTLVLQSGHPVGLFHSNPTAPRVMITNGLTVGLFSSAEDFKRLSALGVANYGQMTAGGWMYIGPQGIVHGTYSTLLNASRKIKDGAKDMEGLIFVTSGLGGMSGAQGKAGKIANGVALVAEVDESRINTRYEQGWVDVITRTPQEAFEVALKAKENKEAIAIAFLGNIIDLLEYAADNNIHIDLLSDQTSCHEVYDGGYCPAGITFKERTELLGSDHHKFKELVDKSLKRHFEVIKKLTAQGTYFFDYGNSFMKAIYDSGVNEISKNGINDLDGFIWPSYVEDILGPMLFDYGYGPFRWVCLSGKDEDLDKTDAAACEVIDPNRRFQDYDNWKWINDAKKNALVVGTKARILYQDAWGRTNIALKFNEMVREGKVGPIMLGRDHHDVSGTDSPFRETSNIYDGSNVMAEMATHCYAGNAARGMSLIALHNGGGVGVGKSINGGFGMVLDGSERVDTILKEAMLWDVMGGVARRNWARNDASIETCIEYNEQMKGSDHITLPYLASREYVKEIIKKNK